MTTNRRDSPVTHQLCSGRRSTSAANRPIRAHTLAADIVKSFTSAMTGDLCMSSQTDDADVIVVGAGPGGSAAGYYLAQAGLDVLLLEKTSFPRE